MHLFLGTVPWMNCSDKTVIGHPHCLRGGDHIFNIKAVRCISADLVARGVVFHCSRPQPQVCSLSTNIYVWMDSHVSSRKLADEGLSVGAPLFLHVDSQHGHSFPGCCLCSAIIGVAWHIRYENTLTTPCSHPPPGSVFLTPARARSQRDIWGFNENLGLKTRKRVGGARAKHCKIMSIKIVGKKSNKKSL